MGGGCLWGWGCGEGVGVGLGGWGGGDNAFFSPSHIQITKGD